MIQPLKDELGITLSEAAEALIRLGAIALRAGEAGRNFRIHLMANLLCNIGESDSIGAPSDEDWEIMYQERERRKRRR